MAKISKTSGSILALTYMNKPMMLWIKVAAWSLSGRLLWHWGIQTER